MNATLIVGAVAAIALMAGYLGPLAFKMKDVALSIVILIGVVVMLVDLWQSMRETQD